MILQMLTRRLAEQMMDRLMAGFSDPETRVLFSQNEVVYDQYLRNFISNYAENRNSMSYFAELNNSLINYTKNATKMSSKIKHLCYEFSDLMLKMSSQLNEISDHIGKLVTYTNEVYSQLQIQQSQEVAETDRKLQAGIAEWSRQIISQRQFVLDNMASFFHFKKHEFMTFEALIESKLHVDEAFKKKYFELEAKKQRLFETKNVEKWKIQPTGINESLHDMLKNYTKAREHMIPEVWSSGKQAGGYFGQIVAVPLQTCAF